MIPISALKDNYIWVIPGGTKDYVVDPGEANPVIDYFHTRNEILSGILVTHHHHDHTGGIEKLLHHFGNMPVYGSQLNPNPLVTHRLTDGDEIIFSDMTFRAMAIPGHTLDHMAYYGQGSLFSGDTLFSAGCGRIFEGTPEQMYASLQKLMSLPEDTDIYCGHEYTLANLKFAAQVEPGNVFIEEKRNIISHTGGCTLPSTLAEEKKMNPFLRCHIPEVIRSVEKYAGKKLENAVDVFTQLRVWKNNF